MIQTVGIVGLGLIGGSLARTIRKRTACRVLGLDLSDDVMAQARAETVLDCDLTRETAMDCDLLLVALYPEATVDFVSAWLPDLRPGTVIVDCAGTKVTVCQALSGLAREYGVHFIGGHPMAGVEASGFESSFDGLFDGASMILCQDEYTDDNALHDAGAFFLSLGFGRIQRTTAQTHDRVIAYTSQLVHLVSNAYIKSETVRLRGGFSAGSFRDITRVAKLNETMWTQLFLDNRENLLLELDILLASINQYKEALQSRDRERLQALLAEGRRLQEEDRRCHP